MCVPHDPSPPPDTLAAPVPGVPTALTVGRFISTLGARIRPRLIVPRAPAPLHQVLGDCNQNSSVIAGGDVFVWGSLRGDVIAGSKGDVRARVFSIDLRPDSVTIGGVKSTAKQSAAARAVSIATGIPECAQVDSNGSGIIMTPANDSARRLAEDVEEKNAVRHFGASARKAAAVTGAYIAAAGVALMIEPARVFGLLFSIEAITDAWIRVFGVLCVAFGTYYLGAAAGEVRGMEGARGFYLSTVVGRLFIFAAFMGMVATGAHPEPTLLVLGLVNFVGALVMLHALSSKKKAKNPINNRRASGVGGAA